MDLNHLLCRLYGILRMILASRRETNSHVSKFQITVPVTVFLYLSQCLICNLQGKKVVSLTKNNRTSNCIDQNQSLKS